MAYEALGPEEFRVFHLAPALATADEIRGTFSVHRFDEHPPYTALSYVWGKQVRGAPFRVCAEIGIVKITKNLDAALRNLRDPEKPRFVWIDALCINQADSAEKGIQVWRMRDIYVNARAVVVWLGEGRVGAKVATDLLERLAADEQLHLSSEHPSYIDNAGLLELAYFFTRLWFSRLWTVQELLLPRTSAVTFHYGEHQISGNSMFRAWDSLLAHQHSCCAGSLDFPEVENQSTSDTSSSYLTTSASSRTSVSSSNSDVAPPEANITRPLLIRICETRNWYWKLLQSKTHSSTFLSKEMLKIISLCRELPTSEPRDKIYGTLGLVLQRRTVDRLATPNYKMGVRKVYRAFALDQLCVSGDLDILSCCGGSRNLQLPSWVPDWTSKPALTWLGYLRLQTLQHYNASRSHIFKGKGKSTKSRADLTLRGYICDTVKSIETTHFHASSESSQRTSAGTDCSLDDDLGPVYLRDALRLRSIVGLDWSKADEKLLYASTKQSRERALWLTFTGSLTREKGEIEYCGDDDSFLHRAVPGPGIEFSRYSKIDHPILHQQWLESFEGPSNVANQAVSAREEKYIDSTIFKYGVPCGLVMTQRHFITTAAGRFGFAHENCKVGDKIAVLFGGRVPYILRAFPQSKGKSTFKLVGDAYIHGIMDGEVVLDGQNRKIPPQEIVLH